MTRLLLVRHAAPAGTWGADEDPGLSDLGRQQAAALVEAEARWPEAVVSSPMRRARETAAPLARRLGVEVRVEPRIGEVRIPPGVVASGGEWLRDLLGRTWDDAELLTRSWRDEVLGSLRGLTEDTVVVTHFVAINVAVGAATGDARVGCCQPAHGAVTELAVAGDALRLVRLGATASPVGLA